MTALEPVLRDRSGAWIGWSGAPGKAPRPFEAEGLAIKPIGMTESEEHGFYHGMSNRTFWPLYHDAIRTPDFQRTWWKCYEEINARYAQAAVRAARTSDMIWVHDYHLQLVPRMIRERKPRAKIGFFLHIPFPPEELFAWLPWRHAILRGLLGADVVGFQTFENAQNFSRVARRYTAAEGTDTELRIDGRTIRVASFPISIDFKEFEATAARPKVIARSRSIRESFGGRRKIILCVDRLDYTKGIDARLQMFEELLRRKQVTVKDTVLVQIAVPSREPVPEYAEMRARIEQTVGRINGAHSDAGRVAVHYFRRSVTRDELVAYYLAADVMLVTPLRDGMNLVAKEYVACRRDNTGVLVLSEFAGAAREMRRALLVNPRDIDGAASVLLQALRLDKEDATRRMAILRMMVRRHDVQYWAESFWEAMQKS